MKKKVTTTQNTQNRVKGDKIVFFAWRFRGDPMKTEAACQRQDQKRTNRNAFDTAL